MASVRKRPLKVVTDSEDDQSDSRQRRDLHITSKRVSTIAEEKEDKKKGYAGYSHTLPIHTITKASVLSKEAPPENYSGFLRLGSKYKEERGVGNVAKRYGYTVLVLGASNIRLIIENWMKYGLLIRVPHHSHIPVRDLGLFMLAWLSVPLSLLISLVVEYGMGKLAVAAKDAKPDFLKKLTILERVVAVTHVSHLVFLLTFPSYLAYTQIYHPLGKLRVWTFFVILTLKVSV